MISDLRCCFSALRLRQGRELQRGGVALAGQPAASLLPLLWGGHCLPLLAGDCSTLCGQVSPGAVPIQGASAGFLEPCLSFCPPREPRPAAWTVYAATVDPLQPLFTPPRFLSHIVVHEGYDSHTRANDIAVMRLTKALDLTGLSVLHCSSTGPKTRLRPCPCFRRQRRPRVSPKRWSEHQ